MKKENFPERLFNILGFFILLVASILSFILDPCPTTIIPFPEISVPIIKSFCALFCVYLIFKPSFFIGQCAVLLLQSVTTTLTGYEVLGTFLFFASILILFCEGFFKTKIKQKTIILGLFWLLVIFGLVPFGFPRLILEFAVTFFFGGFFVFLYSKLKDILGHLLPQNLIESSVELPPQGAEIKLSNYGLNVRQISILKEYMKSKSSYSELAYNHFVSISTVKKDMSDILKIFGVANINDLYLLFLQYKIVYC